MDGRLDRLAVFINAALDENAHLPEECRAFVRAGKRLRARLLLASSDSSPVSSEGDVLRAAAAIELVHAASLLHDDIVDECEERRGRRTLHRIHGTEAATLTGTYLVHRALRLVAELPDIARVRIAEVGQQLARGQLLELMQARDVDVSPEDRLVVMKLKTASVFGLACELGGRLAGEDVDRAIERRRFGEAFGILFQIADDVDDLFAPASEQGRPPATDLHCAVMSLPIIFALRTNARQGLIQILGCSSHDPSATAACRELLRSSGALSYTLEVANTYALRARDHLVALPASGGSEWTSGLVDATLARIRRFADRDRGCVVELGA